MGLKFKTSDATCEYVRSVSSEVFVAISGGKDSLAMWLQVRRFWPKDAIIPFHNYPVPIQAGNGPLRFMDRNMRYLEERFEQRIHRLIHPIMLTHLYRGIFQPPERYPVRMRLALEGQLVEYTPSDFNDLIRTLTGKDNAWIATGIRAGDNPMRRTAVKSQGSAHPQGKTFFPIWDFTIEQELTLLKAHGIGLSQEYEWFGTSFDGVGYEFTNPIAEHSPEDMDDLRHYYPLVNLWQLNLAYRELLHEVRPDLRRLDQAEEVPV